ncbi:MobH family relaxase [Pseudomonas sp. 18175]|uniref:MobH family relaxase n=1 Tax=Pseudomonas sp. 18175 TaxID=3390056 RepID=UPI003D246081
MSQPLSPSPTQELTALPVSQVLAQHQEWIERIRVCYGAERQHFEHEVLSVIEGYAAYVHLLPATPADAFCEPGGLLRLGLETAFYSLQGSDGQIFAGRASLSSRRHLEPRWRLAALIAGLCAEAYRPLAQMRITSPNDAAWPAALEPLAHWLRNNDVERYAVGWRANLAEARSLNLFVLPHLLPAGVLRHLADSNEVIIPLLLNSLANEPQHTSPNQLLDLVRRAQSVVIDRQRRQYAGCHITFARPPSPHQALDAALRQLCQHNPAWWPNRPKSRLWWGADGVFLIWPGAAAELHRALHDVLQTKLPDDPEALLPWLADAELLQATPAADLLWPIQPPPAQTPQTALKLLDSPPCWADLDPKPTPLDQCLMPPPIARPPTLAPEQWPLPLEPEPEPSAPEQPPPLILQAPLRLNPTVRDALTLALPTLYAPCATAQVRTVAEGLFVPLSTFEQHRVLPAAALRALDDAGMLVPSATDAAPTHTRDFAGTPTHGVIIAPRFIGGLDPAAFIPPTEPEP